MQKLCIVILLIEPVWNRNEDNETPWNGMESTFNRTSMESKRISCGIPMLRIRLLIEPVWNRNSPFTTYQGALITLLIEPVWNRN